MKSMKNAVLSLFALALMLSPISAIPAAAVQKGVEPSLKLELIEPPTEALAPGDVYATKLLVTLSGEERDVMIPAQFIVFISTPFGPAQLSSSNFTLQPGVETAIPIELMVVNDANPGTYTLTFAIVTGQVKDAIQDQIFILGGK